MRGLILFLLLPIASFGQNWVEIWSDEFDGNAIDPTKWVHEVGTGWMGWGNNELQYYTASSNNSFVDTGYLHIVARQEQVGSSNYTSARMITEDLFDFQYGKIEARIKVPVGQGLWPAFWMLGADFSTVGWPHCGEIDIMEHVNLELQIHGTHHYDMWGHTYEGDYAYTDASLFHLYTVEWDENEIRWYLDGVEYFTTNIGPSAISKEEFHTPFFVLLNLAVGGNWPGSPNGNTVFPATMMVDYVRVYQQNASLPETQLDLSIYPNPVEEVLGINVIGAIEGYTILNSQGQQVLTGDNKKVAVSALDPGIYWIEVIANGHRIREQFSKQ